MRRLILEFTAAIGLTLAATLALATGVSASDVIVKHAFARASATPTATAGAVYLTIVNDTDVPDRLLTTSTPVAAMAHLHETVAEGDVMKMEMIGELAIAPHMVVALKPGGTHIMLMGLKAPLQKGGSFPMDLTFEKAGKVSVIVAIGGVAAQTAESPDD